MATALDRVRRHLDRSDGRVDGHDAEAVLAHVVVEGVLFQVAEARGGFDEHDPALGRLVDDLVAIVEQPVPQVERFERGLLLLAEALEPKLLDAALERLVDAVLPEQLQDRADRGHEERGRKLVRKGDGSGWTILRGDPDLECGELLFTVLTAAAATDPDNPVDTSSWAAQRDARDGPAPRSRVQRDHDALALGLRALLDAGALGIRGKRVAHVLVTVPLSSLQGEPGSLPAVAASGAPLPGGLVRRLLCDSRLDPDGPGSGPPGPRGQPHRADPSMRTSATRCTCSGAAGAPAPGARARRAARSSRTMPIPGTGPAPRATATASRSAGAPTRTCTRAAGRSGSGTADSSVPTGGSSAEVTGLRPTRLRRSGRLGDRVRDLWPPLSRAPAAPPAGRPAARPAAPARPGRHR